jgi:FkbM family methyltransferase
VIGAMRTITIGEAGFAVADDKDSFWDKVAEGRWEPETLAAICDLADERTLLIDIGCWIGPITLLAAALGARVLTFEPDPRAFELLSANIAANPALAPRVKLHHVAVSPAAGRIRLGSPKKPGDSMGSILAAESGAVSWEAEAITPALIADMAAGAGRIVLKMDIEGGEYALLPHLGPLLSSRTVAALIAFHPRLLAKAGHSAEAIQHMTKAAGVALAAYRLRTLDTAEDESTISQTNNSTILLTRK